MNNPKLIRWTGIAVIIAAISILTTRFIPDTPLVFAFYGLTLLCSLIGFIGIYQYQKEKAGVLSIISLLVFLSTFIFYAGGADNLGDITFPIAFLILGLASFQSGKFPRWAAGALVLSVVFSLTGNFLFSLPKAIEVINSFIFTAGFCMLGYTVWTDSIQPLTAQENN